MLKYNHLGKVHSIFTKIFKMLILYNPGAGFYPGILNNPMVFMVI